MKVRFRQQFFAVASLIVLASALGCSGVGAQPPDTGSQQLPFTGTKPLVVPADTIIYIRLQQPVTSATAQAGQSFAAVLDEPLLIDSQTIAPQGTEITGKVLAARESGRLHRAGYVRITLSAITVNGKTLPIQTDSVIAGGGSFKNRNLGFIGGGTANTFVTEEKAAGFTTERRLGFRLTQPLNMGT